MQKLKRKKKTKTIFHWYQEKYFIFHDDDLYTSYVRQVVKQEEAQLDFCFPNCAIWQMHNYETNRNIVDSFCLISPGICPSKKEKKKRNWKSERWKCCIPGNSPARFEWKQLPGWNIFQHRFMGQFTGVEAGFFFFFFLKMYLKKRL